MLGVLPLCVLADGTETERQQQRNRICGTRVLDEKRCDFMITKKYLPFLFPLLSILCTILLLLLFEGFFTLLIFFLRDVCLPVIHFCVLARYLQRKDYPKYVPIVSSCLLLFVTIFNGCMFKWLLPLNIGWFTISFVLVSLTVIIKRYNCNHTWMKVLFTVISITALISNGLITYYVSPLFDVDGIELAIFPASIFVLCIYSYVLGRFLISKYTKLNLLLWSIGVLISEFISLSLLGNPPTTPFQSTSALVLWIVLSLPAIACALIGSALRCRSKTTETTVINEQHCSTER
jgi:hypothetical protein